ncbi:unnamed protein product [Hymenolepis diminuta]|uniref:Uncharacterized protein n=1 Tax=Hymenolepis diminuta TaxID=6216 RepID=A0A564YLJ2_HYMDI|nr:unnamed protein product [Hymenolepis diminuta]
MIEEKTRCAAVNIPASGVLVIGGNGSNGLLHRFTELLTQRSEDRVLDVGWEENLEKMEMLDVNHGSYFVQSGTLVFRNN